MVKKLEASVAVLIGLLCVLTSAQYQENISPLVLWKPLPSSDPSQ